MNNTSNNNFSFIQFKLDSFVYRGVETLYSALSRVYVTFFKLYFMHDNFDHTGIRYDNVIGHSLYIIILYYRD